MSCGRRRAPDRDQRSQFMRLPLRPATKVIRAIDHNASAVTGNFSEPWCGPGPARSGAHRVRR